MVPACQLCGSVTGLQRRKMAASVHLLGGKKLSPSSCLDARHSNSSLYATDAFQAATPVLELRRSLSKSMCRFFKKNCWKPSCLVSEAVTPHG